VIFLFNSFFHTLTNPRTRGRAASFIFGSSFYLWWSYGYLSIESALHPKLPEYPCVLNYQHPRKGFKNDTFHNPVGNPMQSLWLLFSYFYFTNVSEINGQNHVALGYLITLRNISLSGSNHINFLHDLR